MENEYAFKLSMRKEHGIGMIHANNKFRFSDKLILYHNYQDTLALYTHQPTKWSEANDVFKPDCYRSSRSPFPPPICG